MSLSELTTRAGRGDAWKFFYLYENVIMNNKSDEEKVDNLVTYPKGKVLDFYLCNFTIDIKSMATEMYYPCNERFMLDRFA